MSDFTEVEQAILEAIGAERAGEASGRRVFSPAAAREAAGVAALIGFSLAPVEPPVHLKARLLTAVTPGTRTRAGEGSWRTLFTGVQVQKLASNRQRNSVTLLLEMAPGSTFPGHGHHGQEESYVVSGSCHFGEVLLETGDFFAVAPGQSHGDVSTVTGCRLLIVADYADAVALG